MNQQNNYVEWNRFTWIIGALVVACMSVFAVLNSDIGNNEDDIVDLKSIVPAIQANMDNMKDDVKEIKDTLKIIIQKP